MAVNIETCVLTKCAKIVGLIGTVISIVTIILNVFTLTWWYIPMATVSLLTYILVYMGIEEKRSEYLTPAVLILGIHLVVSTWVGFELIYIGYFLPNNVIFISHIVAQVLNIHSTVHKIIQIFYLIATFVIFLLSAYTLFSFIVIHKARILLRSNCQASNDATNRRPVYVAQRAAPDVLEYPDSKFSRASPKI